MTPYPTDAVETELVDILSMCAEHEHELRTMFGAESERTITQAGESLPDGIRRYLNRLESRGIVRRSTVEDGVWELTETGVALADEGRRRQ
ncbi:MAG: hypothetical protein ABW212_05185 [Pseudonocardia sediminis]